MHHEPPKRKRWEQEHYDLGRAHTGTPPREPTFWLSEVAAEHSRRSYFWLTPGRSLLLRLWALVAPPSLCNFHILRLSEDWLALHLSPACLHSTEHRCVVARARGKDENDASSVGCTGCRNRPSRDESSCQCVRRALHAVECGGSSGRGLAAPRRAASS